MKCVECRYRVARTAGNSGFECGIKLPRGYENIGGNPYVPDHWGCDLGKPKDPVEVRPDPDAEITDADRLHWVMNNVTTDMMNQFVRHVLTVGGVGDLSDCRAFLDPKIRESRRKAQTNQEAA